MSKPTSRNYCDINQELPQRAGNYLGRDQDGPWREVSYEPGLSSDPAGNWSKPTRFWLPLPIVAGLALLLSSGAWAANPVLDAIYADDPSRFENTWNNPEYSGYRGPSPRRTRTFDARGGGCPFMVAEDQAEGNWLSICDRYPDGRLQGSFRIVDLDRTPTSAERCGHDPRWGHDHLGTYYNLKVRGTCSYAP